MSAIDTLCFDDFDPVPSPTGPTLDGFFLHDLGLNNPGEVEMGYTRGCRYSWSGGGVPMALFQGVKAGNFLVFGFFTRFDQRFNSNDKIIIALKPAGGGGITDQRRIDIAPVFLDLGAGPGAAGPVPDIRSNQAPQRVTVYKGFSDPADPAARWEPCAQAIDVKVRSWRSPSPPPPPPNTPDVGWSVEVKIPITAGADWININDGFGLFFSMIRNIDAASSTFYAGLQFPRNRAKLTGADSTTLNIPDTNYGTGRIGANLGQGVRFKGDLYGIGRLDTSSGNPSITQVLSRTNNRLVARIENTSPTDTASDVVAEFRFGRYGLPSGIWHDWKQPDGMMPIGISPKRTAPITLAPNQFGDLTTDWRLTFAEQTDFGSDSHRCMVAELFSNSNVNFTQGSIRNNMDFTAASEVSRGAEVSGVGYPPPEDGSGELEFLLFTYARVLHGPAVLDMYNVESDEDPTATLTRRLLTQVIPPEKPEEADASETANLAIKPSDLRWYVGEEGSKTVRFLAVGRGKKFQLRVLRPSPLDGFDWKEVAVDLAPGEEVEIKVFSRGAGASTREARMYYRLSGFDRKGKPAALQTGAVLLTQDGERAPRPGSNWKEVLSSSQVILWTTFGFLRTGQFLEVDGVKGEVLDETPGEFSIVALHEGPFDLLTWQISGPSLTWEGPGINRLKVPFGGETHLDVTLKVDKESKPGDLGPRLVQADPLVLHWNARQSKPRPVRFTLSPKAPFEVVLDVLEAQGESADEFVWKPIRITMRPGDSVEVDITPPSAFARCDRIGELRYQVLPGENSEVAIESGRVRLLRRGGTTRR